MNKHLSRLLAGALATALVLPGAAFAAELPQTDLLVPAALSPVTPAPDSHSSDPLARSAKPETQTALTVDERVQLLLDAASGANMPPMRCSPPTATSIREIIFCWRGSTCC